MAGYIAKHRSIMDHWLYTKPRKFSEYEAWDHLLMIANHTDHKFLLGRELIEVEAGQVVTSIRKLCERWKWSNTKVVEFLNLLESDNMIVVKKDTKKTVITIVNWGFYQLSEEKKRHENDTKTTQKHTINNDNKDNKKDIKEISSEKPKRKKYSFDDTHMKIGQFLFEKIRENFPNTKEPNFDMWANEVRLMMEKDNRSKRDIHDVIVWTANNSFWRKNILSTDKLRKQFDKLLIEMQDDKKPKVQRKVKGVDIEALKAGLDLSE
ncbi:putative replication initiator [Bacillus phage vB_BcM_Sam46]|uniref:DnaD domain-containing protein n=2 Tax=Caudoviricetes TaxID=2731619 RepID=A0A5Q2F3Y9_9CAUD|nr:DnaD domain-containing protein [Bacillus phage vB_BcM_Sam112]QIQ61262.1 putative replication initiator [Bacillus phage vB_BcM_Sam46]